MRMVVVREGIGWKEEVVDMSLTNRYASQSLNAGTGCMFRLHPNVFKLANKIVQGASPVSSLRVSEAYECLILVNNYVKGFNLY